MTRLHDDQVDTDPDLVRQLLSAQTPQLSRLPLSRVREFGTDHHLYRLGDDLLVRMPIIGWAVGQARSDEAWLPRLAPYLPVAVPAPLLVGEPGFGYPYPWAVVPWLDGATPTAGNVDAEVLAADLAAFVRALHAVDAMDGPAKTGASRGVPLAGLDDGVRRTLAASAALADIRDEVLEVWEDALTAPAYDGTPVWIHGDLMTGNLLVREGRLSAVIDWGGLGLGDPAPDLCPAYWLFDGGSRSAFLESLAYDDATLRRARGWIVAPAVSGVDYYADTFPTMARTARASLEAVIGDLGRDRR